MMEPSNNLNYLFGATLRNERLDFEQIQFAQGYVSSDNPEQVIMANSVLFLAGDNSQKASALHRIGQICEGGVAGKCDMAVALVVTILEKLSKQQLLANTDFVTF